jgi:Nucleotidyl transferase AbiEii toxin, Type IV TA system
VTAQSSQPDWVRLFHLACGLIRQVNSEALVIDYWTFGGRTAMMLQIDHRESRDVDFFLQDPQLLAFLDPEKHDFDFEIPPTDYTGDGTGFLKFVFADIGQIDFIIAQPKTVEPVTERLIEGVTTLLETVPEIIAKKIVHRGSTIQPRDIFDIAAASEKYADALVAALSSYKSAVGEAIKRLELLNLEFVNNAISELQIREKFRPLAGTAIERTKQILTRALQ